MEVLRNKLRNVNREVENIAKNFAVLLNARKERLRLTQREIAERCGVSLRTAQNWTAGESEPQTAQDLRNLCAALDVPLSYFVGDGRTIETISIVPQTHSPNPLRDEPLGDARGKMRLHLEKFIESCGGDESRLAWGKIQMEDALPLNKWPRRAAVEIAADAKVEMAESERKRKATK